MGGRDNFEIRLASVDDAALLTELGTPLRAWAFGAANEPEKLDHLAHAFAVGSRRGRFSGSSSARRSSPSIRPGTAIGCTMVRRNRPGRRVD